MINQKTITSLLRQISTCRRIHLYQMAPNFISQQIRLETLTNRHSVSIDTVTFTGTDT
jgi:hypothetical protein